MYIKRVFLFYCFLNIDKNKLNVILFLKRHKNKLKAILFLKKKNINL